MSAVAVTPIALNGGTIKIGTGSANTYEQAVSSLTFTPSQSVSFVKAMSGNVYPFITASTWEVAITAAQDLVTATSLQNYLLANAGTSVPLVWTAAPGGTGAKTVTQTVVLVPAQIGGAMDKNLEFTVTLAGTGTPVIATAP